VAGAAWTLPAYGFNAEFVGLLCAPTWSDPNTPPSAMASPAKAERGPTVLNAALPRRKPHTANSKTTLYRWVRP